MRLIAAIDRRDCLEFVDEWRRGVCSREFRVFRIAMPSARTARPTRADVFCMRCRDDVMIDRTRDVQYDLHDRSTPIAAGKNVIAVRGATVKYRARARDVDISCYDNDQEFT